MPASTGDTSANHGQYDNHTAVVTTALGTGVQVSCSISPRRQVLSNQAVVCETQDEELALPCRTSRGRICHLV